MYISRYVHRIKQKNNYLFRQNELPVTEENFPFIQQCLLVRQKSQYDNSLDNRTLPVPCVLVMIYGILPTATSSS